MSSDPARSHANSSTDAALSLDRARSINGRCERFEAQWRAEERPRIASFLSEAGDLERSELFRELLALELELRRDRGESPGVDEYLHQFPEQQSLIAAAFSQVETRVARSVGSTAIHPARPRLPGKGRELAEAPILPLSQLTGSSGAIPAPTIGEYELIEEIARGGMGVVYKARHRSLKRQVALKMILSGSMATSEERERFRREAELAANLDHPNIVPIYEVDEHHGRPYFCMKLVDGGSLARQAQAGPLRDDPAAAARLVSSLARAVHYAHEQKFLHCDLKPSNVLLDAQGRPYLTDFGLARRTGVESSLSISGTILGTPSYMAPEQATGARAGLGPATDVYGLGAILYELLTGRPPFRAPTIMETVVRVLERDPAPPRELRPEVPRQLESICLKCLEKAPKDRYASAAGLADEIDQYLRGDGIDATGLGSRWRRWNRREPELVARLGGLALIAVLTQYNYAFLSQEPHARIHYTIQAVLGLWALASTIFQLLLRHGWQSDRVRVLWSASDIVFLTLELKMLGRVETTLLVGYPLLVAASGLWWRVQLVWTTTVLAMAAYLALYLDATWQGIANPRAAIPRADLQYPNIFLAALLLTGYVVVRQVKRILALGRYYEHRGEP